MCVCWGGGYNNCWLWRRDEESVHSKMSITNKYNTTVYKSKRNSICYTTSWNVQWFGFAKSHGKWLINILVLMLIYFSRVKQGMSNSWIRRYVTRNTQKIFNIDSHKRVSFKMNISLYFNYNYGNHSFWIILAEMWGRQQVSTSYHAHSEDTSYS